LLGLFCIQTNEFFVPSSFKAAGTVKLIREVVLERRQQKRSELPFEPVDTSKRSVFQQVQEKTLGQVLGVFREYPRRRANM
jgi:hypothetical protein